MKPVCANRMWILAALAAAMSFQAGAQPRTSGRDSRDSNENGGVGVARITYATGDASARRGERGDIMSAEAGLAVLAGDTVTTHAGARVEVRFDHSNFVRLSANSEIKLRQIGARVYQLDVIHGSAEYTMMKYGEAEVNLHSPAGDLNPRKPGVYRLDVTSPNSSLLTARKGEAEVMTPDGAMTLKSGRSVNVRAPGQKLKADFPPKKDAFDEWAANRDKALEVRPGPAYAGGPWYPGPYPYYGWGWGWPFWGGYWGSYWGGYYYPRVGYPVVVHGGYHHH